MTALLFPGHYISVETFGPGFLGDDCSRSRRFGEQRGSLKRQGFLDRERGAALPRFFQASFPYLVRSKTSRIRCSSSSGRFVMPKAPGGTPFAGSTTPM